VNPDIAKSYLWVAIGSAFGGMSRYWVSQMVAQKVGSAFPWGTIIINISGSFVIGIFLALTLPEGRLNTSRSFISEFCMYGICGGYTTFSSFSMQTLTLMQSRQWLWAGGNVLISVAACLMAVWLRFVWGSLVNLSH
jgi:fluoride exporter